MRSHVHQSIRQGEGLLRSQGGPRAGAPFTASPTCRETTINSQLFRVLLLRRLRQQVLHVRAGVLSRRSFSLESSRTHLQRGWGSREDERICPRFGVGDGRRLWLTDCHCSAEGNWQSTPRCCARAGASSIGRPCCGSWGQVLEGDGQVPHRAGQGSGTERNNAEAC